MMMAPISKSALIPSGQLVEPYGDIEARIQAALKFLHTTQEDDPDLSPFAKSYEIPVRRLQASCEDCQSEQEWPAANRKLSEDQEIGVCQYLDRLDVVGTSARLQMVTGCANSILQQAHTVPSPALVLSKQWLRHFVTRHPEYSIGKQHAIDADRKNGRDAEDIHNWFERCQVVCKEYTIEIGDISNFDATGFGIGIGRDQWVITRDPYSRCFLGSSTNRELVTVCETISCDGIHLPPMIIIPGVIHQAAWYAAPSMPDNYLAGTSEKGLTKAELTIMWLVYTISSLGQVGTYRLLLHNSYSSHCTKEFIDYCDLHNVIPFCLSPHSSYLLQPLDVVVFQPYKHYHTEAVKAATSSRCSEFDKVEFLDRIDSICQQTFKTSTICAAFRATGVIPYNPDIVISKFGEAQATPILPGILPQVT